MSLFMQSYFLGQKRTTKKTHCFAIKIIFILLYYFRQNYDIGLSSARDIDDVYFSDCLPNDERVCESFVDKLTRSERTADD